MSAPASSTIDRTFRRARSGEAGAFVWRLGVAGLGLALALATAAAVRFAPVRPVAMLAIAAGLLLAGFTVASPLLAAGLLGASIPELQDVSGGHLGLHVAASDVVLVLIGIRLLALAVISRAAPSWRVLRPVRFAIAPYAFLLAVLLVLHPGLSPALKSLQRLELFVLPLLVGAWIALRRDHNTVLRAYVLVATLLAVAWPVLNGHALGTQFDKNATGQLIADGILLLVAVRDLRRMLPCLVPLVVGLAFTASRGAVLALAVGLVVLSLVLAGRSRRVLIARTVMILLTGLALYQLLPGDLSSRLTSFSATTGSSGSYNIDVRFQYAADAQRLIASHPFNGVGVGQYLAGSRQLGTLTTDPHDVILLEAAEGGYLFAAAFVLLILGVALALWRLRRIELAAAASAVLLATAAHGLVDVYWVRGLPVLGFLLVGMTCALAAQRSPRLEP